jgi:hypothetical protein
MYLPYMDLYKVSLATGAVGLGIMAIVGLSHGAHAGHSHAAHVGHSHSGSGSARLPGMRTSSGRSSSSGSGWKWTSLLSPRLLFSFFVGFGAGGILAASLHEPLRFAAAVTAGIAFEAALVGPLWRFLFRFESREASTLETAIEDESSAVTGFDANGNGLVALRSGATWASPPCVPSSSCGLSFRARDARRSRASPSLFSRKRQ